MPLHRITINTQDPQIGAFVSDVLFELGSISVSVEDNQRGTKSEIPIFGEPSKHGTQSPPCWDNAQVTALFPIDSNMERITMIIATHFNLNQSPVFSIQQDLFDEQNPEFWVKKVQEAFVPIYIGKIRISLPRHHLDQSFINIVLQPGLAFGTGEHPTTKLCLSWLQKVVKPNLTVLDYGTGSGVLSIAAVLLEKKVRATGVDIDPYAVTNALSNAKRNKVDKLTSFFENPDEPLHVQYDIVVANILAEPLKWLASDLVTRMKNGGYIGLSGVLCKQALDVMACYQREGVVLEQAHVDDDWALLVGRKPL